MPKKSTLNEDYRSLMVTAERIRVENNALRERYETLMTQAEDYKREAHERRRETRALREKLEEFDLMRQDRDQFQAKNAELEARLKRLIDEYDILLCSHNREVKANEELMEKNAKVRKALRSANREAIGRTSLASVPDYKFKRKDEVKVYYEGDYID